MPWSEFILRSAGIKERKKDQILLTRRLAYEIYCGNFIFSSKKPAKIDKFWPIEPAKKPKKDEREKVEAVFIDAFKKYKKQKDAIISSRAKSGNTEPQSEA